MRKTGAGRLEAIDLAKGLAITLVVWGHVVAGDAPSGGAWYMTSKSFVYLFHMPFFMFLSGVVAGYGYRDVDSWNTWGRFVKDKLWRLLPAYLLVAITIVIGKIIAARYVYVDNVPDSIASGISDVLLQPNRSNAKSFWFVYVLFLFYVSLHPLMRVFGQRSWLIIVLGLFLQFFNGPEVLLLNEYFQFLLFFALGVFFGQHYQTLQAEVQRWGMVFWAAFLVVAIYALMQPFHLMRSVVGLLSIPALLYAISALKNISVKECLAYLGKYSFAIYLFNTIFIGVAKAVGLKIAPWDGANFYLFAPSLFCAGLLLPVMLKRYIFCHIPFIDKITR